MTPLGRARLVFLSALVVACGVVVAEFPVSSLVAARDAVSRSAGELRALRSENKVLGSEIARLDSAATISELAHRQYGLVASGQETVVIIPPAGAAGRSTVGEAPLDATTIPASDLVPSDAELAPTGDLSPHGAASFWERVLDRLEFWKGSS